MREKENEIETRLAPRSRPASRGSVRFADTLVAYDGVLSPTFCADVISLFDGIPNKGMHDGDWRRCFEYPTFDQTPHWPEFRRIIGKTLNRYRADIESDGANMVSMIEAPNVFRYDVSEKPHLFARHADAWNTDSATRQISIIAYLNDVEEGGETEFADLDVKVAPRRGRVLVFPSSFLFMHAGLPPISGPKYVIVTWLHFAGPTAYRSHPLFDQ